MARFDEVELESGPQIEDPAPVVIHTAASDATRFRRMLALFSDLSLFIAMTIAMSALLPASRNFAAVIALGAFIVMTSYYYFVGTWLLWGKTIGGAIFDVKVAGSESSMSLKAASLRWCGLYASLATGGIGFLIAALPDRRSLADRLSHTRCVATF